MRKPALTQKGLEQVVYAKIRHFRSPLRLKMFSFCLVGSIFVTDNYRCVPFFSCKEPVEPLSLDEVADRCHAPEDVNAIFFY